MAFVRIENPVKVVPSMEMLRTLGASSARGHAEKIGQFGSGFPNTLALFSREGILDGFKVCLGKEVFTYPIKASINQTSSGDEFIIREILIKKQNGASLNLNISTEFGALDWTDVTMGLREIISNAIDGTVEYGLEPHKTVVEIVEDNQTRAKEGTVRVYVPLTREIEEYLNEIDKHFLCLSRFYDPSQTILVNKDQGPARFYRKGVKVGSFGTRSLFHYNLEQLDLKESRIVDSSEARTKAAEAIRDGDVKTIEMFLRSFDSGEEYFEHRFSAWDMMPTYSNNSDRCRTNWVSAYHNVFGDAVLCETPEVAMMVRSKGFNARVFPKLLESVLKFYIDAEDGLQNSSCVLSVDESKGRTVCDPTNDVLSCLDKVWSIIERHGLTNGKSKPSAHCYTEITRSEGNTLGYYRDNGIYILRDIASSSFMLTQTMIEEVSHHVTGATDCTREFQDYAFRLAATMIH